MTSHVVTTRDYWMFQLIIMHDWVESHSAPIVGAVEEDPDYKHFWVWDKDDMSAGGESIFELLIELEEMVGENDPLIAPLLQLARMDE